MTTKRLLCETLKDLSSEELEEFILKVELEKGAPLLSKHHPKGVNVEEVVELMVEKYSEESVELTKNILMKMNRTDLVQRLSDGGAGTGEKHSVQTETKQRSSLIQRVEMIVSDIEVLMDTLADLNEEEIEVFRDILIHTPSKINKSWTDTNRIFGGDHQETVFSMIMTCGQDSVEKTREILKKMGRTDLLQRLSDTSSRLKKKNSDEQHSALIQKVATMAAVQQLLLETLRCLSERELQRFMELLEQIVFRKGRGTISSPWRHRRGREEIVDQMMELYGQQSVELSREVLEEMNRTDLTQMLLQSSSTLKEKQSVDEHEPSLLEEAVKENVEQLLFQTLWSLSLKELEKFKFLLRFTYFQKNLPQINSHQLEKLVNLMLMNQQPVEVTKEVLMDMNRSDLVERLSGISSGLKGESLQKEPSSLDWTVFKTLKSLSSGEFEQFKDLVWQTAVVKTRSGVVYPIFGADRAGMTKLMVKSCGQRCVEVTADVLQRMKRTDLVEKLLETSSQLKTQEEPQPKRLEKESTLTADHEQLLEILEKLSSGELEKFKHVLQYTKLRGLPKIPSDSMKTDDRAEIVKLMVENYGQQSLGVTKDVLGRIERMDLVETLSGKTSGSQGPSGSLESEPDSSLWTKLEPGVNSSGGDESPTYSLQCETGKFECSVSGLRWVCKEEVSFQYHFCSWGGHMERMESMKYTPAGPLMDIKVMTGRLNEVYLPHWICTEDDPKISDNFAALHIDDYGDVVENVSEVTPTHVKLSEPVFSPRAALIKVGFPVKTRCNMLLYKSSTAFLTLHVYLIPCDPGLQQEMDKRKLSDGYKVIQKPHPEKSLKMRDRFILTADVEGAEIYPEDLKLRYECSTPNFFEVFIENPDRNIILKLSHKKEGTQVWTCALRRVEYQTTGRTEDEHQNSASEVSCHQCDHATQSLTHRMQAVTINTTDRERLLKTLEDLKQEEFKKFKWYLQDSGVLNDLQIISKSELENKDMLELVDLMLSTYRTECMELTRRVLRAMNKNDLVEKLSGIS